MDGTAYFVSVVGVDEFGNKSTEVTSVTLFTQETTQYEVLMLS